MLIVKKLFVTIFSIVFLVSCGGGGSADSVSSTLTFNLSAALTDLIRNGQNSKFSVSSSSGCSGDGILSSSAAKSGAMFEGQPALEATTMINFTYTKCMPALFSIVSNTYYDANYVPIGALSDYYLVYNEKLSIPTQVRVNDVGILGTLTRYSNSSKANRLGIMKISYLIEADTATTALLTIVANSYGRNDALEATQLTRYTISEGSALEFKSMKAQFANEGYLSFITK